MKKTISLAALTISAATSSFAIVGPPMNIETTNYCLDYFADIHGNKSLGSCDQKPNNRMLNAITDQNGCTKDQAALFTSKRTTERDFPINVRPCLPPNVVQL